MTSINGVGRRVVATLVIATAAAILVSPAVAARKDAGAATRTEIIARLAPNAHVSILAHEARAVRIVLKRCKTTLHIEQRAAGRHPLTVGIDILATLARLPGQAAIAAQHTLAALAKVTPRVLRAVL